MPLPRLLPTLVATLLAASPWLPAANVRDFGARGDGTTDDTAAIEAAVRAAADGTVEFPRGRYRLTRTVEIALATAGPLGITGRGGAATVVMAGPGPAFRFVGSHDQGTADPRSVRPVTRDQERLPVVADLEIAGAHPEADGVEFRHTLQPTIRGVLIRQVRHGLHFTGRNRNVLIHASHLYDCHGIGVFLDAVNIHQIIIGDSHVSYCRQGGIKVVASEIRNFQITGNDIEYNFAPGGPPVADIWFDLAGTGSVREGTISGNTIQALRSPGGANIRFTGIRDNPLKIGVWSITGNHLASQETNIHLTDAAGVTITGNTFLRGFTHHLLIERSRNILLSGNILDRNADYFTAGTPALGGIVIDRSTAVLVSQNLIEGIEAGSAEAGGAVLVTGSREVSVLGNQIRAPRFRGLHVRGSSNVQVADNLVSEEPGRERMLAAVELEGDCPGTVVRGNLLAPGRDGSLVNRATGATVTPPDPAR